MSTTNTSLASHVGNFANKTTALPKPFFVVMEELGDDASSVQLVDQHLDSGVNQAKEIPVMISLRMADGTQLAFPTHVPKDIIHDAIDDEVFDRKWANGLYVPGSLKRVVLKA